MTDDKLFKLKGTVIHFQDPNSPLELERKKNADEIYARLEKIPNSMIGEHAIGFVSPSSPRPVPFQGHNYKSQDNSLQTICAGDAEAESTIYVVQDLLVEGEVSSIFGSPGVGKGLVTCTLAARVSLGEMQLMGPVSTPTESGIVLFHCTEDDFNSVILPRSKAAGANLDLLHSLDGNNKFSRDTKPFTYSAESEKSIISWAERKAAEGKGRVRLIVFDPGLLVLGGAASTYGNVQAVFSRLRLLAKRLRCAILLVFHDTKFTNGKAPLDRANGNRAIVGGPRCVMYIGEIENGPTEYGGTRVLLRAKSNLGKLDGGYEFGFQTVILDSKNGPIETSKIVITREIPGSPMDIIKLAESGELAGADKVDPVDVAVNYLNLKLKDGPVWGKEVEKGKPAGITTRELDAAKVKLGVDHFKETGKRYGRTLWFLPGNGPK